MHRRTFIPLLFLLSACGGLAGTYTEHDGGRLREHLTLFPDSTYQYQWWTDIIMSDQGRWSLAGDTLVLERVRRHDVRLIVRGHRLQFILPEGGTVRGWELRRRRTRPDTLFSRR